MVAAHTKEGCCIDGADVMYFMNVNRFKNKTKKSTHNILSLFTAVFLHPDITIPVDWAKKKKTSYLHTIAVFQCYINILFIYLHAFTIAIFQCYYQRFIHLFIPIYYCRFSRGQDSSPRDCRRRATAAAKRLSPPRSVVRSLYRGPLTTQSTFYLQRWQHKAPLLTALTTQSTFTYNTDDTKHLYLHRWQHKAPLLTTLTTQSTFTYSVDNTKHLYLQHWQHKAPLLTLLTTQSTFTYNNDNTKLLYLQHKAALLTAMTTQSTFPYNTKQLYLQRWQQKPLLLTTQSTFTYNRSGCTTQSTFTYNNTKHLYLQ